MDGRLVSRRRERRPSAYRRVLGWALIAVVLMALQLLARGPGASAAPLAPVAVTLSPSGPYVSGQTVTVTVPPNSKLKPGRSLYIEECSAPDPGTVHWFHRCDPRTKQKLHLTAGTDGTATYEGYPLYELPDVALGESGRHRPQCDLTHPCVVVVGWDLDDPGHRLWSASFLITTPGGDPGTGTPEVPFVLALPVLAAVIIGGWMVVRRRRTATGPD